MIGKAELLRWVQTLDEEACIGIDEGGCALVEVLSDGTRTDAYIEVGGVPEEDEEEDEDEETNPTVYQLMSAEVPYLPGSDPTSKALDS